MILSAHQLCAIQALPESLIRQWLLVMLHGSQCEPVACGGQSCGRGMGETTGHTVGGCTPEWGMA